MSEANSSLIISSQTKPHQNLEKIVHRYMDTEYQDTIPEYAMNAFDQADQFVKQRNQAVILDNGCGTGESTVYLAQLFPEATVLGIDKSNDRLNRIHAGEQPENLQLIHCDCIPFWRLVKNSDWKIQHQYFLYPNPWPKPGHLQRRWHAHPVFPTVISLGGELTMRTNWQVYAQEFQIALKLYQFVDVSLHELVVDKCMTPFERKYSQSKHQLFEVSAKM